MGLDMYLTKRRYVKNWEHMKPDERHEIIVRKGGLDVTSRLPVTEIVYEAAYWRKANAVHNWFVQNVQDGEDDCKEYWVSREQLTELMNLCKKVLKVAKTAEGKVHNGTQWKDGKREEIYEDGIVVTNPDEVRKILPPTEGFFFGSTDIDGWFLDDMRETVEQLELALSEEGGDFYYQSSW